MDDETLSLSFLLASVILNIVGWSLLLAGAGSPVIFIFIFAILFSLISLMT